MQGARRIRGLLLDMDGVLADTEPLHARAWVEVMAEHGIRLEPSAFDRWVGLPNLRTATDIIEVWKLRVTPERLLAEHDPLFLALTTEQLRPYPGVREWLERSRGFPRAVATSGHGVEVAHVLGVLGLAGSFGAVVTAEDVRRTKPDPEAYLRAAQELRLDARDCAAVEDSPSGVEAAVAAGCLVLAVTTTFRAAELGAAHAVFPSTLAALGEVDRMRGELPGLSQPDRSHRE